MAYEKANIFLFAEQKLLTTEAPQTRAVGPLHSHLQVPRWGNSTLAEAALCDRRLTDCDAARRRQGSEQEATSGGSTPPSPRASHPLAQRSRPSSDEEGIEFPPLRTDRLTTLYKLYFLLPGTTTAPQDRVLSQWCSRTYSEKFKMAPKPGPFTFCKELWTLRQTHERRTPSRLQM